MVVPVIILAYISCRYGISIDCWQSFSSNSEAIQWLSEADIVCNLYVDAIVRWYPMVTKPICGLTITWECLGVLANG